MCETSRRSAGAVTGGRQLLKRVSMKAMQSVSHPSAHVCMPSCTHMFLP